MLLQVQMALIVMLPCCCHRYKHVLIIPCFRCTAFYLSLQSLSALLFQADQCSYLPKKIELYTKAMMMCKAYKLKQDEASVHCRLSHLILHTLKEPRLACEHANNAILADPNYGEVSLTYKKQSQYCYDSQYSFRVTIVGLWLPNYLEPCITMQLSHILCTQRQLLIT